MATHLPIGLHFGVTLFLTSHLGFPSFQWQVATFWPSIRPTATAVESTRSEARLASRSRQVLDISRAVRLAPGPRRPRRLRRGNLAGRFFRFRDEPTILRGLKGKPQNEKSTPFMPHPKKKRPKLIPSLPFCSFFFLVRDP